MLLILFFLLIPLASATEIYLFYGQGCPHCENEMTWLKSIEPNYNFNLNSYEIYFNPVNRELAQNIATSYNTEIQGVPTLFINDKYFVGFSPSIAQEIEEEIIYCENNDCINPSEKEIESFEVPLFEIITALVIILIIAFYFKKRRMQKL